MSCLNEDFLEYFEEKFTQKFEKMVGKCFSRTVRIILEINVKLDPHLHEVNSFSRLPRLGIPLKELALCKCGPNFLLKICGFIRIPTLKKNPLKSLKKQSKKLFCAPCKLL